MGRANLKPTELNEMKRLILFAIFTSAVSAFASDFQGPENKEKIMVGLSTGIGMIDPKVGIPLVFNTSTRLLDKGWLEDVSDQVFLEFMAGPTFYGGNAPFQWGMHARWDFRRDSVWTYFATGGLGGQITGPETGDRFAIFPRFGIGALKKLREEFSLRADLSHEWILIGAVFGFSKSN